MKAAGISLLVAGILAFLFFGVNEGPEPEWLCGDNPNLLVAVVGYRGPDGELESACRAEAIRGTIKASVIGGGLFALGVVLAVSAAGVERRERAQHLAGLPSGYGQRSHDGAFWWDGHRWQPVPPAPPSGRGDDGDDAGPGESGVSG